MAGERQFKIMRRFTARLMKLIRGIGSPAAHALPGIYPPNQFRAAIEREQARAERNGHQVTLAVIPVNGHPDSRMSLPPRVMEAFAGRIRLMDEAGWLDDARIGVLMPCTSCRGAWCMIDDLCRIAEGRLSASDCKVYVYPYDWAGDNGERPLQDAAEARAARHTRLPEEHLPAAMCPKSRPSESNEAACPAGDRPAPESACVHPLELPPGVGPSAWQRALDILCSILGLTVLSPLFTLAALLIKLVSPGPVFFRQVRIGQGGRPFILWKFRTMTANADCSVHQGHVIRLIRGTAENGDAAGPMTKLDNDPRVIPLGGLLRGACIDELPQLINVLRGEMSLVGPRPPIAYEVSEYQLWQRRRLDAVPGLTGLWQVSGKNRLTFDEMVRLDIRYSRQQSLGMNIMILLRTPRAIAGEIADLWARCKVRVRVTENA